MTTTFVTRYVCEDGDRFTDIAKTGVNICLYADAACDDVISEIVGRFENVKWMQTVVAVAQDLFAFKVCSAQNSDILLPCSDNITKDTSEHMIFMNSKIELVKDAMDQNPFHSRCFAWIDCNITKLFSSTDYVTLLRDMNDKAPDRSFLAIPGCYANDGKIDQLLQSVYWRFCGGFFWGDKASLDKFYQLYLHYFPKFIAQYSTLVWEVNFWAWLEAEVEAEWSPHWYLANHDDSILRVPYFITSTSIRGILSSTQIYDYPPVEVDGALCVPSSASYIRFGGKHMLNTRYVNYTMDEYFRCHHAHGRVITVNMLSTLDENLRPMSYDIIEDPPKDSCSEMVTYNGIEDIRLYEKENEIHYIATSMSHSDCGKNSIVTGIYNHLEYQMETCRTLASPLNKWCEKNWTPVVIDREEYLVYQWSPMEIYNQALEKIKTYHVDNPIFRVLRGSTVFTRFGDNLLGLVHFSEGESMERKYFHMLLLIDGITMEPLKCSNHFHFCDEPTIEFCTGFAVIDMKYQFWISVRDASPRHISVAIDALPLCNRVTCN
jgi:hypothetical protein